MGGTVHVVGSFNVDHVWRSDALPQPGETRSGQYHSGPGGKGFNQAVAACRAGAPTVFVCALGADAGGQLARALATADGIDLRDARSAAPTGTAGIYVDAEGRNSIVVGAGANAELTADHAHACLATITPGNVLLVQAEIPIATASAALARARACGAIALLNPAPADADIPPGMLALCDILTPNETEFCALLARAGHGQLPAEAVATMGDAGLHALCRLLQPQATVVVTLGAAGSFVSHAEPNLHGDTQAHYRVPAAPADPVDTTGAGDAFNGALAASLVLRPRLALQRHLQAASAYAARATERRGAADAMPRMTLA